MLKNILFILFIAFAFNTTKAQDISCEKLMSYVKLHGYYKGRVDPWMTNSSSWIWSVSAYSIENKIAVVATLKTNNYGGKKDYVFCGIPEKNWYNFTSIMISSNSSYGKRFHKYIMPYKCDCY